MGHLIKQMLRPLNKLPPPNTNTSKSNPNIIVYQTKFWYILGSPKPPIVNQVRYILIIFSVFLFSLTVISCAKKSDSSSSSSATYQLATNDYANGVATDSSGNVYVTGGTKGGLDGNTSAGNTDLFVVKYNSSGTKQWTKQLGTSSTDSANGIAFGNNTFLTVGYIWNHHEIYGQRNHLR